MLGVKGLHVGRTARDQCGWSELRKLHECQLFGVVAQRGGFVEHLGTLALGLLQQVGGVDEFGVKRWVFTHQHRIEVFQSHTAFVAGGFFKPRLGGLRGTVGGRDVQQADSPHLSGHGLTALPSQVSGQAHRHAVPTPLRLAHHHVSGVFVGFERLDGVGNDEDVHKGKRVGETAVLNSTLTGNTESSASAVRMGCQ